MRTSILIPAFNAAPFLPTAVRSALNQHDAEIEVVIAADDDVDYARVLADAGIRDSRIVHTATAAAGSGPSAARNAALAASSGEILAPLDADDCFYPDRVRLIAPLAREHGAAACDVAVVDKDGALMNSPFPGRSALRWLSAHDIMDCGVPIQPLIRRDVVGAWPAELRFAEDVIFNLQVLSRADAFPMHWRSLYSYQVHEASLCHRMDAWQMADAGYAAILAGLETNAYDLRHNVLEQATAGFTSKRAFNAEFGCAYEAGEARTFQEFLARRRKHEIA